MNFFTLNTERNGFPIPILVLWLSLIASGFVEAQTSTNGNIPVALPASVAATNTAPAATAPSTNVGPANTLTLAPAIPNQDQEGFPVQKPAPVVTTVQTWTRPANVDFVSNEPLIPPSNALLLAALLTLSSLGGFLLYQSGLTRAKNCGHSATLLLIGVTFAWVGYWVGGFAVQDGGLGDSHAALTTPLPVESRSALDHELGFIAMGHHWGVMGSTGFFMATDASSANTAAAIFFSQLALLTITVAAALGASLERARLLAMAVFAFIIGAVIYPFFANWVWGGGWLAELGQEDGLGHGFVDLSGASVVHETAGTLALVIAIVLGSRHARFGAEKRPLPGHNMPFVLLGAILLLVSWTAANAFVSGASMSLAAANTLLAAAGGLFTLFLLAAWNKRKPEPALICRGLLGGAIASAACAGLIDPWAAFIIGCVAGLLVQGALVFLENRRIDDPTSAAATHGMSGAWGAIATGFFANGNAGSGVNGVESTVRGLFYGGGVHQLLAQLIGAVTCFVVVFILGYFFLLLIQKILGIRVPFADETNGLDFPQTGALGYQGESEPDSQG